MNPTPFNDNIEIDLDVFGGPSANPPKHFSLGVHSPKRGTPGNIREFLVPHPTIPYRFILFLSNSTMDKIFKCEVMADYYLVQHRNPSGSKIALAFGGALHKGWARHFGMQVVNDQGHPIIDTPAQIAFDSMKDFPVDDSEYRTAERASEIMELYAHHYFDENFKVLAVEEPFLRSLGVIPCGFVSEKYGEIKEVEVIWNGIKDVVVEGNHDGSIWILDHKSTSRNDSSSWKEYEISPQMQGYVWDEREKLKELGEDPAKCHGVIIDMAVVLKKTRTGKCQEFLRQNFRYDEETIREWKWIILSKVQDFLYKFSINTYVPNRAMCCGHKYGPCSYLEICKLNQKERLPLLDSGMFEDVTWTNLGGDGESRKPDVKKLTNVSEGGTTIVPKDTNPFDIEL